MSTHGQVASGHYLASVAGYAILRQGGTAIDAGIAAGVALNVLRFDQTNLAGVAPIILYHAATQRLATLDGLGIWPKSASVRYFEEHSDGLLPDGILRSVTPGAPDSWLTALERFGTLSVGEILEPAWELATEGAPISTGVADSLRLYDEERSKLAPTTIAAFFPDDRPLQVGECFAQPELARVLKALMDEEARARREGLDRPSAIRRARDLFYNGWIADEICRFQEAEGGWIRAEDLAAHRVEIGSPEHTTYKGYDIYSCGFWCQGPVLLQTLNILSNFELEDEIHNSASYLHIVAEAMNLAFADRENFYGDPRIVDVPSQGLLSDAYAKDRAATIDRQRASGRMPMPGNPWRYNGGADGDRTVKPIDVSRYEVNQATIAADTSYVAAADAHGNLFSATPSDPVLDVPVIPSLGFSCSGRGCQSRVDAEHPSGIAPGKRPRLTPNPALAMVDGSPLMAFGCPGGDIQTQGMLQVFLNLVHFGMNPQQAIEAPRVMSWSFPNSFAPHEYYPGRLDVETRITEDAIGLLSQLGHDARPTTDWDPAASAVHLVLINPRNRVLIGGADPRNEGAVVGW